LRPDKILLATEGCSCPGVRLDDWLRAERLAHDVMYDLMNFGQGWIDWNLLLDSTGGPNHLGNQCDAPLVALSDFSDVHVQPTYYYMGQISKFVPPGSIRVQASIVGDFELRPMDPNIQAGVELGLFPCERSVRQTWQLRPEGNASNLFSIALSTPALRTDSFTDAVHSDDDLPPVISSLCVASGDANRGYLRLVDCGDASSSDSSSLLQVKLSDQGQMVDRESNLCVGLSADSLESGALLSLGACVETSPTQTFSVDDRTGEIRWKGVSEADPFCWTAGWPFLSTVGFLDPEGRTVLVVLNEASVAVEITIISDLLRKESIISDRSIQTIIF
jgi:glucosylceramidase